MGQRKPYKKQKFDKYHQKGIEEEIENELDIFYHQDPEESILFLNEEPNLFNDEPKIVKQLRQEEIQGKLPMWLADFNKENSNDTLSEKQDSTEKTTRSQQETNKKSDLISKKFE